ncbi:MAG: ABC transporter permease [Clostridiales Family XIII bacterium]|jgi:ABC-2 type transport system permease protein|nr:ABC transporter permease [Clostridiales Family XIII bacterium]
MSNFFSKNIHAIMRDKSSSFFMLLFPTLLVFVLGNMLGSFDEPDSKISEIHIGYVVEIENEMERASIDDFMKELNSNENITATEVTTRADAKEEVVSKKHSAAVIYENDGKIKVLEGDDGIAGRAVELIMKSYVRQSSAIGAAFQHNPEKMTQLIHEITELQKNEETGIIDSKFANTRSMIDYYAVTMAVMCAFMISAIGGVSDIYTGRKDNTLSRVMMSPSSKVKIYLQMVAAQLPQNVIQIAIIMLACTFAFHAHYASTVYGNVLLVLLFIISGMAVSAFTMLFSLLVKFNPITIVGPLTWMILFVSGSFNKNLVVAGFDKFSPPYLIQNAAFDLTVFDRDGLCYQVIGGSIVILILSTIVGALLFQRKGLKV